MNFHDRNHPIWPILRLLVMMVALSVILYFNASHFDSTEIKTIIYMFIAAGSIEGVGALFQRGGQ